MPGPPGPQGIHKFFCFQDIHTNLYCTNASHQCRISLEVCKIIGPPGMPGKPGICPKCPVAENFEMHHKMECPKVEPMECPTQITLDGEGGPRYTERELPYFVRVVYSAIYLLFFFFFSFFFYFSACI